MIVISPGYALTLAENYAGNLPVILWDNRVVTSNIFADGEDPDYPATNLANPSTVLFWQGADTADQYLTVTLDGSEQTDAVGLARQNFASAGIIVSIEGEEPDAPGIWIELAAEMIPADDSPLLFRFAPTYLTALRIKLQPVSVIPRAAVLYVGSLLVMERGVQVHTPITYGRRRTSVTGKSESGDFLGRIITSSTLATTADITNLTPAWYRANLDPFAKASAEVPFFFAWNPEAYPSEVGFVWLTNDLVPQTSNLVGYINVSLDMEGVGL